MSLPGTETFRISPAEMQSLLHRIFLKHGVGDPKAKVCAEIFTRNSLEGVYSHGINRVGKFVEMLSKGLIRPETDPRCISKIGALEQWDGGTGIGITNALACTGRAVELAKEFGIGYVALANTNHWMRGGTYARHAISHGFAFIGWSNTIRNTPAWGAVDPRLGNNPLVVGVPFGNDPIVLDMAMSQYSYGALDMYKMKGESLPVAGGFDKDGNLTRDPKEVLESQRTLPIGYWKGSGLSLLLDIVASITSGGLSVSEISKQSAETKLSQVFIAINASALGHAGRIPSIIQTIVDDLHGSRPEKEGREVRYPGENISVIRDKNSAEGIPVVKTVWEKVLLLG